MGSEGKWAGKSGKGSNKVRYDMMGEEDVKRKWQRGEVSTKDLTRFMGKRDVVMELMRGG